MKKAKLIYLQIANMGGALLPTQETLVSVLTLSNKAFSKYINTT